MMRVWTVFTTGFTGVSIGGRTKPHGFSGLSGPTEKPERWALLVHWPLATATAWNENDFSAPAAMEPKLWFSTEGSLTVSPAGRESWTMTSVASQTEAWTLSVKVTMSFRL